MTLKNFHVVFIFLAFLMCIGFGAWALLIEELPASFRIMGWISASIGVLLFGYGICFVRKTRKVIT